MVTLPRCTQCTNVAMDTRGLCFTCLNRPFYDNAAASCKVSRCSTCGTVTDFMPDNERCLDCWFTLDLRCPTYGYPLDPISGHACDLDGFTPTNAERAFNAANWYCGREAAGLPCDCRAN